MIKRIRQKYIVLMIYYGVHNKIYLSVFKGLMMAILGLLSMGFKPAFCYCD